MSFPVSYKEDQGVNALIHLFFLSLLVTIFFLNHGIVSKLLIEWIECNR